MEICCGILLILGFLGMIGGNSEKKKKARSAGLDAAAEARKAERAAEEAQKAVLRAQASDGGKLLRAATEARQAAHRAEASWRICRQSRDRIAIAKANEYRQIAHSAANEAESIVRLKGVRISSSVQNGAEDDAGRKRKRDWSDWI